jgi:hypothetical protein
VARVLHSDFLLIFAQFGTNTLLESKWTLFDPLQASSVKTLAVEKVEDVVPDRFRPLRGRSEPF